MLDFIGRKLDCSVILLQINVIETISMKIQTSICNRYGIGTVPLLGGENESVNARLFESCSVAAICYLC